MNAPSPPAVAKSRITLHYPGSAPESVALDHLPGGLSFKPGFPDEIFEFRDVFLVRGPDRFALYDEAGERIDITAVRRGVSPPVYLKARERIEPPAEFAAFDAPALFLSKYVGLWGHLITETASRLWARHRHPELAALPAFFAGAGDPDPGYSCELFSYFDGLKLISFRQFRPPLKLKQVFVPAPSFVNLASAHAGHRVALHQAAERMLSGKTVRDDPRPVYFSRTKLQSFTRGFDNEVELERVLQASGFLIVHPETLDVRAQVELINAHRVFVGIVGSAMHNLLFALRGEEKVAHIFCEPAPQKNYLLADAVVGGESHYVGVCLRDEADERRFNLDVATALSYLREQGLIPNSG